METKLVAKISVSRLDKLTRTGTGYPIGDNLLLTARHVVEFAERDKTKPLTVEWLELGKEIVIEPQAFKFIYDGGEQLDVVLLSCSLPEKVAGAVTHDVLERQKINTKNNWETLGFPQVHGFDAKDATGIFGVDQGSRTISLTLDDTINAAVLKANGIENGWGGMSGAPVFCCKTQKLQAVITVHDQWMQKQLIGVSIPYLMQLPEFRAALGLNGADEQHQKYLAELPQRIIELLRQIEKSVLYQKLVQAFFPPGHEPSPEQLWEKVESKIGQDRISLLEQYRNVVAAALKVELSHINAAQTLFLHFLGFFSEPGDLTEAYRVHQLPVRTRLAVEIHLAARYGLTPDLIYDSGENVNPMQSARGRFAIDGENAFREVGWQPDAIAKELAINANIAVNKVHQTVLGKLPGDELDEFALEFLDETIRTRRQGENPQLIRLEVPSRTAAEPTHPLHNNEVCAALHERLPNLPVVRYGSATATIEAKLCTQVREFFLMIQQYHQNP